MSCHLVNSEGGVVIVHHSGGVEAGWSSERGASRGSGEQRERPHNTMMRGYRGGVTAVRSCCECAGCCACGRVATVLLI